MQCRIEVARGQRGQLFKVKQITNFGVKMNGTVILSNLLSYKYINCI
jgi:hypothetical protein